MSNTTAPKPMTFDQFCEKMQQRKRFYAIINGRVRRCHLASFQPWNAPMGITYNIRGWGFFWSPVKHAYGGDFYAHHDTPERESTSFKSFKHKRDAKAYLAEANRDDDRVRNGINAVPTRGMV